MMPGAVHFCQQSRCWDLELLPLPGAVHFYHQSRCQDLHWRTAAPVAGSSTLLSTRGLAPEKCCSHCRDSSPSVHINWTLHNMLWVTVLLCSWNGSDSIDRLLWDTSVNSTPAITSHRATAEAVDDPESWQQTLLPVAMELAYSSAPSSYM